MCYFIISFFCSLLFRWDCNVEVMAVMDLEQIRIECIGDVISTQSLVFRPPDVLVVDTIKNHPK